MENKKVNPRDVGNIKIAIMKSDIELVKKLLNEHLECLNYTDSNTGTLLHFAAEEGNIEVIKYLLSLGVDINRRGGTFDASALRSAIASGNTEAAKYLLDAGIEMDTGTGLRNPLLAAIFNRQVECVKLLIERGIDVSIVYEKGEKKMSALTHAHTYGTQEIIDIIEKEVSKSVEKEMYNMKENNELVNYIEKHLGKIDETISEIIPGSRVKVDINIIRPTKERNYITLITTGMSEYAMGYSEDDSEYKYAELMMKLPPDWKLDKEHCKSDAYGWPLKILRMSAHLPHNNDGIISNEVIIPNGIPGDVPLPYHVDTWLSAVMFCDSEDIPPLKVNKGIRIDFFTLVPICDEEIETAINMGSNNFMHTLPTKDIVDEARGFED